MQVNNFLEHSAQQYPDKPAVWYKNEWMTYGQIEQRANQIAHFLVENKVRRGERVALLLENSFDYIINYYAVLKAGAVTVALNTETNTDSLIYLLNDSGSSAIITQAKFSRHIIPALPKIPYLKQVIIDQDNLDDYKQIGHCTQTKLHDVYRNGKTEVTPVRCIDLDLASLVYTSGSTGKPKGVMLTHLNIVSNTRSIVQYLELTESDRIMVVLPFYYIYGKSLLNTHFFAGGSVVIDNRFAFPNVILETMKKTAVTGLAGVPSTFMILLEKSTVKQQEFNSLRYVTQAGGAMAPVIQKEVARVFKPAKLFIMYGATEASARLSYLDPADLPRKWGSIGKAIPNVDLFIADENGTPLPPHTEGQIVARGSNLMQGYWNDYETTVTALRNGLYYTGDIGKMDEEGFVYVVGRTKDMIKVGGERISAKEIEEIILELKEVQEVAVIGVDDNYLGEAIKAFIVLASSKKLTIEDIKNHCKRRLSPVKIPKYIELLASLPKNQAGKVLKQSLREKELKK
jgi:acyl-CoA synthetase (AMP-forming)/AMP-acid ligase II